MQVVKEAIPMDVRKLQDAVNELEAEGHRCLKLAAELKLAIKREGGQQPQAGAPRPRIPSRPKQPKAPPASYLELAVGILKEQQKPMHVKDILPLAVEHRPGTTRGSIESALVRGMESVKYKGLIKRTAPSTFAVQVS